VPGAQASDSIGLGQANEAACDLARLISYTHVSFSFGSVHSLFQPMQLLCMFGTCVLPSWSIWPFLFFTGHRHNAFASTCSVFGELKGSSAGICLPKTRSYILRFCLRCNTLTSVYACVHVDLMDDNCMDVCMQTWWMVFLLAVLLLDLYVCAAFGCHGLMNLCMDDGLLISICTRIIS
jgi:hypothetical protein